MCGCVSTANRSFTQGQRSISKKIKVSVMPLEYYQNIDTSGWEPGEKAILRSQINIYNQQGDVYYSTISAIQSKYSDPV